MFALCFCSFQYYQDGEKGHKPPCVLRIIGEVKMLCNWFGNIFVVNLNISKVFAETITQFVVHFANVYFFA